MTIDVSLPSVLRSHKDLSQRLSNLVSIAGVPRPSDLPLKALPRTQHYSLVGSAFDYLFRFEVQRRNPLARTEDWVAEAAVKLLKPVEFQGGGTIREWPGVEGVEALSVEAEGILNQARAAHQLYLRIKNPSGEQVAHMALHTLRLAKLDVIYRAEILDPSLGSTDALDVEDLVQLWNTLSFDGPLSICLDKGVRLNPTFGSYSVGFRGTDAGLIAGTKLIDIETTIKPDVRPGLAQLLGYTMAADTYRLHENQEFPRVESIALYFARQGRLVSFPMQPIRGHSDYVAAFEALMQYCHTAPPSLGAPVRRMFSSGLRRPRNQAPKRVSGSRKKRPPKR